MRSLIVKAASAGSDPHQIRLLVLGLVSSSENYFRQLLCELLSACPLCHEKCSKLEIKYSSASYFSNAEISQSLTDSSVFSSAENITEETKRLTGFNLNDSGSVKAALAEYHKVCILRHASVHSYGILGGKNISDLGIDAREKMVVALTWDSFQEISDVCQNLVRAYNNFLWRAVVTRLREKNRILFNGLPEDKTFFDKIQRVFWKASKLSAEGAGIYTRIQGAP